MSGKLSSNPIILISGANRGLGLCTVQLLLTRHPKSIIIAGSRDKADGEKSIAEMREEKGLKEGTVEVIELDVQKDDQVEAAVQYVQEKHGRLDVLVNNAGALFLKPENRADTRAIFNQSCDLNFTSVAVMTYAFLPLLRKAPSPRLINVTSGTASIDRMIKINAFMAPAYSAAKTGLNGLTVQTQLWENNNVKKWAEEGKGQGVGHTQMYVIAPGLLKTRFSGFMEGAKDPLDGAEVIVQLALKEDPYPGGKQLEWDGGFVEVPW